MTSNDGAISGDPIELGTLVASSIVAGRAAVQISECCSSSGEFSDTYASVQQCTASVG